MSKDFEYTPRAHGITFGTIVACYLSWMKWHSVGYAILHGILSWIYVVYYWAKYGF
jgi:hypothetical protein